MTTDDKAEGGASRSRAVAYGKRLAVVVLVVYGSLWWSYERFYDAFGIRPDDVGTTAAGGVTDVFSAILRLGVWLLFAVMVLGLVPVMVITMWGYVVDDRRARGIRKAHGSPRVLPVIVPCGVAAAVTIVAFLTFGRWAFAATVGVLIAAIGMYLATFRSVTVTQELGSRSVVVVFVVLAGSLCVTLWSYDKFVGRLFAAIVTAPVLLGMGAWSLAAEGTDYRLWPKSPQDLKADVAPPSSIDRPTSSAPAQDGNDRSPRRSSALAHRLRWSRAWWDYRERWVVHVGEAFVAVAIVALLYVDLPTDVAEVGRRVRDDNLNCQVPAVRAPLPFHLDLVGVRALPATFKYPYTATQPHVIDALYLGQANGFVVAYSSRLPKGVVLLPAATTRVEIHPRVPNCPGVH